MKPDDSVPPTPRGGWSIARRLTLLYAAASVLLLMGASVFLQWALIENLNREDDAFLADKIEVVRSLLREGGTNSVALRNEVLGVNTQPRFLRYFIRLVDSSGQTLLETPGLSASLPSELFPAPASATTTLRGVEKELDSDKEFRLMAATVETDGRAAGRWLVQVALDGTTDATLLRSFKRKLLWLVLVGTCLAALAGIWIARKGLAPVRDITRAADRITASQLHERIAATGWPQELADLARSFDSMLNRLEDSFTRLSQFSADLAHELRTPVNNLRGEAGVALAQTRTPVEYRQVLESSLEEYARMSRLIENLLFLARADGAVQALQPSTFSVRLNIESIREFYEAVAEEKGILVTCEGEASLNADPVLFRQAVSNLLANALHYTQRGGKVTVYVTTDDPGAVDVAVSDTGCGITPEHLPRVFDRFFRADPARSAHSGGTGLGLAIVKSIVALHGGTVSARSELGKGTAVTLRFPSDLSLSPSKITAA